MSRRYKNDELDAFGESLRRGLTRGFGGYRWVDPNRENRTKEEYPYSYSDHYLWGDGTGSQAMYHDRMREWDAGKFKAAWDAHLGESDLRRASASQMSAFLSAYLGKIVTCTAVAEGCNVGNGYPYWVLYYRDENKGPYVAPPTVAVPEPKAIPPLPPRPSRTIDLEAE